MNSTRIWTLISILVIAGLLLGTWFVGISPKLAESTAANSERASVEGLNATHEATLAALKTQYDDIDRLRKDLDELRVAIPNEAGIPDLISELNVSAADAGVSLASIKFADPAPYAPIENADADPELAAALPSVAPENFLVIPVDIEVTGQYSKVMAFVSALQHGDRLFLVHDLSLAEGTMQGSAAVNLIVSGQVFVLLDGNAPPAVTPDGQPSAPAGDTPAEGETPQ